MKYLLLVFFVFLISCDKQARSLPQEQSSRSKGKKVLLSTESDLVLTLEGTTFTTTVSPNADFSGIQKFVTMGTADGAVSLGNWNYWWGGNDGTESVQAQGSGFYRGLSSDEDGTVHVSNVIQIP